MSPYRLATFALIALAPLAIGCGGAPQLGDEQCLTAADALWTAVTSRQQDLVEASALEIERLHSAETMPQEAYEALTTIVESARAGQWSDARAALKILIRQQRRPHGQPKKSAS